MKKNIGIILIVTLLLFVTGCSEKQYSVTIKEYYDLKVDRAYTMKASRRI